MPWEYTEEYYREYTRTTWNESADAYITLLRTLEPYRTDLLARLNPQPREWVLDLGTGPGEPAMTIAQAVGHDGRVTGVDLSENMIAIAKRVAKARTLRNVEFEVMDCSALKLPDAGYDAAICCFGFQIFTDPEGAAREAFRVLKPGGRIAVVVWSQGERTPFLDAIIAPMLEHAEPDENGYIPTPYETGGPGEMVAFLHAAGFRGGVEARVTHTLRFENPDAYLRAILKGTPIGHSLGEEEPKVQEEVLRKTRANLEKWMGPTGLAIPAEGVLVTALKG